MYNLKLALVLPGGGACGRWQIGVLKYLYDMKLFEKINLVCGTSVGGLNSLLVGKYLNDFDKAVDMWSRITKNKDIFNGMLQLNSFWDFIGMAGQLFKSNKGKSLLDPVGLYQTIDRTFGNDTLLDLKVPVIITTTDLSTGERVVINSNVYPDYKSSEIAKATSAIPGAFPAVDYWLGGVKDLCVDGGVLMNNPVALAIEQKPTHIILIGTSPDAYPRKEIKNEVFSVIPRLLELIMHRNEETSWEELEDYELQRKLDPTLPQIKTLDIYPQENTGSALNFSNVEQFQKGYEYAQDNLPPEVIEAFLR